MSKFKFDKDRANGMAYIGGVWMNEAAVNESYKKAEFISKFEDRCLVAKQCFATGRDLA